MINQTMVYAIRCLMELAKRPGKHVEVREVARAQGIPECYCQKVLYALAKGGIVSSWKGRGFGLERPVSSINVMEVMEAVRASGKSAKAEESALVQELNTRIHDLMKGLFLGDLLMEGSV
ncbi:MAG: Rrf2 family transcriptional regulator [Elusimicrobia bacterium]|nr:Rrf2 family transcriptional regulator [Elusimicrobiota bacterium]